MQDKITFAPWTKKTEELFSHNRNETGRTIQVQIVDDFGRDLPPDTIQKLLADAEEKSNPRDSVVGVRFKIPKADIDNPNT